jgi:hypothetical protein
MKGQLKSKKSLIASYIFMVATLIAAVFAVSYAWFATNVIWPDESSNIVDVTTATLGPITFYNGETINVDSVYPGWCETKRMKIEAEGNTAPVNYEIKLNVVTNTLVTYGANEGYISYRIKVVDSNTDSSEYTIDDSYYPIISDENFQKIMISTGDDILLSQTIGLSGSKHVYDIEFCYPDLSTPQNRQQNQTFTAYLSANASANVGTSATDSNPGVLEGAGTSTDPYMINSIEDLVAFGISVDNGNNYEGKYIKVAKSYDFKLESSYVDASRTDFGDINENGIVEPLITELTTAKGFNPIGDYDNRFNGNFDGNNKVLLNLYINRKDTDYIGLFAYIYNSTFTNYNILDADISGNTYVGILSGEVRGDSSLAISAMNISINNIEVSGNVNSSSYYVGGLAGRARYIKLSNLSSNSTVTIDGNYAITDSSYIGGLIGYLELSTLQSSSSLGNVINNRSACNVAEIGGLVGYSANSDVIDSNSTAVVQNYCGEIVGGLIGTFRSEDSNTNKLTNSYSTGTVINMAPIRSETDDASCPECGYTGGLIGYVRNKSTEAITISSSYSTSNVTSNELDYTGGLIGGTSNDTTINIKSAYSSGNVVSNKGRYTGGFIGHDTLSAITNCYSTGNVISGFEYTDAIAGDYTGGFIGSTTGTITKSYSLGNVITYNGSKVGGFIGRCVACTASDIFTAGNVVGTNEVGRLIGYYVDSAGDSQPIPTTITTGYYISTQTATTDGTTEATLYANTSTYGTSITPTRDLFETTLAFSNSFEYYSNAYPLLYKLDNDTVSNTLLSNQIQKNF